MFIYTSGTTGLPKVGGMYTYIYIRILLVFIYTSGTTGLPKAREMYIY